MVLLLFFTPRHHHSPPPLHLLLSHHHQLLPAIRPTAFSSVKRTPILARRIHTRSRRWDSNAETFRTQNFDFDDFEDDDDDDDTIEWLDILEDFIDGVWIFKVFRSFGWMLPAIISSFLLTSGPKAFLMALAIPLSQSVLSFVFQTVWGRPRNKTKSRGKSKRRPPPPPRPRAATSMDIDDDEQEDENIRGERKRTATGYQTWVAGDGGSTDEKSNGPSSSFGGWEELDTSKTNRDRKQRKKTSKSTLSRRERRSQTPFLLRLLIAVFPFLGSWTRLL